MFGSWTICKVMGIPIKAHFTLFLVLPLFARHFATNANLSLAWGLLLVIALFTSVALHELGHSWVAIKHGYHVRDIILTPIGGVALLTQSPKKASDEFKIAIAGPLVSLGLAILFIALALTLLPIIAGPELVFSATLIGVVNLSLFLFNLLPCFPMDGGRMYRAWMMKRVGRLEATRKAVKIGTWVAGALVFIALLYSHLTLILIAIAVFLFARMELRGVEMEERRRQPPPWMHPGFPPPPFIRPSREYILDHEEVHVSPPPYRRDQP
ncbi:MAG TPA: site-2 protease family protein [Kiritimatiellia bacterium]|nr:site-2 protease family protein [Kiritimatiellia bacterium]